MAEDESIERYKMAEDEMVLQSGEGHIIFKQFCNCYRNACCPSYCYSSYYVVVHLS